MKHKFLSGQTQQLGDRSVRVIASTGTVDRTGEIVAPSGINLKNFQMNPVILWQHDPEHPIGIAGNVAIQGNSLCCDITFAPAGISKKADEICGLVKAGILSGISIGFDPVSMQPMDPTDRWGPQKYTAIDLMEISVVSIPANTDAMVVQRQAAAKVQREGRTLSGDTVGKLQSALASINDAGGTISGLLDAGQTEERSAAGMSLRELQAEVQRLRQAGSDLTRFGRMMEVENLRAVHGVELPRSLRLAEVKKLQQCR